jgi:hypothetical protein
MTLDEYVDFVCTKTQNLEDDDRAACQQFVSKRYELIYNSYLWKDSLAMVDVPVDAANNMDNLAGIVMLPAQVDRLVAIRTKDSSVRIRGLEHFYRIDWDSFSQSGVGTWGYCPSEMSILNPVWLTVRPAANTNQPAAASTVSTVVTPNEDVPPGRGSPEGVVTANPGKLYLDLDTNNMWIKAEGFQKTGWRQMSA